MESNAQSLSEEYSFRMIDILFTRIRRLSLPYRSCILFHQSRYRPPSKKSRVPSPGQPNSNFAISPCVTMIRTKKGRVNINFHHNTSQPAVLPVVAIESYRYERRRRLICPKCYPRQKCLTQTHYSNCHNIITEQY
jgi:hypothetical protein